MKYLKKFYESASGDKINFSQYHTISNEDIEDLSLEMTDMNFWIDINKFFIGSGGSYKEPTTHESWPIYDINFKRKDSENERNALRWDGGIYYEDSEILKSFLSVLNKMNKMLPVEEALYGNIRSDNYTIRLILPKIKVEEIGFDFRKFAEKFSDFCHSNQNWGRYENEGFGYNSDGASGEIITDGVYDTREIIIEKLKDVDRLNNKDQYDTIKKDIKEYLDKYSKYLSYEFEFSEPTTYRHIQKIGMFKKVKKLYDRYKLEITIKPKNKD